MKKIVLSMVALSVLGFTDFSKSGDVITDNVTELQWQDDDASGNSMNWREALEYCEELTLGGFGDWRLPNINELNSIVDETTGSPAIDPTFEYVSSNGYWTSTSYASFTHFAWSVGFGYGLLNHEDKSHDYYVRCVREAS